MGDRGDLYSHRNHKAYWGWGTGCDLYTSTETIRLIGDGGQGDHRNHQAYSGRERGGRGSGTYE